MNSDDFVEDYIHITYQPRFRKRLKSERYGDVHSLIEKLFEEGGEQRYATREEWQAFNADVDRWLIDAHARHPVAFAVKAGSYQWGEPTEWHKWSVSVLPRAVLPRITEFLKSRRTATGAVRSDAADLEQVGDVGYLLHTLLRFAVPEDTSKLPQETRLALVETIGLSMGFPDNQTIDDENREFLERIRRD